MRKSDCPSGTVAEVQSNSLNICLMSTLQGKTLFITGASRGIGRAIALRAARDGANIVVAAKTVDPDPRLPGTIHEAAREIELAGGKALAVVVDVRDENQVQAAIEETIRYFGRLDILVNNASAIHPKGAMETPLKRYDLMMDINVRGSFVCAQAALPHLLQAPNPHILTLAPPLDLQARWFAPHVAYTTSKFAMGMISLGLAAEFGERGLAANTLWPRTFINTAALTIADPAMAQRSRTPHIMADAAHVILTRPSKEATGQAYLDEQVLRDAGVTDFSAYAVDTSQEPEIDWFVTA